MRKNVLLYQSPRERGKTAQINAVCGEAYTKKQKNFIFSPYFVDKFAKMRYHFVYKLSQVGKAGVRAAWVGKEH